MQMYMGATGRLGALAALLWLLAAAVAAQDSQVDAEPRADAEPEREVEADREVDDDPPPTSAGTPQLQLAPRVPDLDEVQEPEEQPLLPSIEDGQPTGPLGADPDPGPVPYDRPLQTPPPSHDATANALPATGVVPTSDAPEDHTRVTVGVIGGASILFTGASLVPPTEDPEDPDDTVEVPTLTFARIGAFFDYRLPEVLGLVLGFGAATMVSDSATALELGPRLGLSYYMFSERDVSGEVAIIFMPGVFIGVDGLFVPRAFFDLHGALELRFELWRALELRAVAAFSQISGSGWGHFAGSVGYAF